MTEEEPKSPLSSIEKIHYELRRLEELARAHQLQSVADGIATARHEAERLENEISAS